MSLPHIKVDVGGGNQPLDLNPVTVGANLGGGLGLNLRGINNTTDPKIGIDIGLPTINIGQIDVAIKELPTINLHLDTIRLALEPVRCHVPVDFSVCFNLFGHEVAAVRFCGESQFIAEPYVPNPCECAPSKGSHGAA